MKKAQAIVGPANPTAFHKCAEFARNNGIYIINNFLIKDESQRSNPFVMQSSLPHDLFYSNAADYFIKTFPDATPVILHSTSNAEKAEMDSVIQARMTGRMYLILNFKNELSGDSLIQKLPKGRNYAFITNTNNLDHIAKAIELFSKSRPSDSVYIWGYHEWLRRNTPGYSSLENCNGYIFGRFYVDALPAAETQLGKLYKKWYGGSLSDNLPHWFACGFDTGMYLIKALNVNGGDFRGYTPSHIGEEYGFDFITIGDDKGLTNKTEMIITILPGMRLKHVL